MRAAWLAAVLVLGVCLGGEARGHGGNLHGFDSDEVAWMNRQRSVSDVKCCDEHDVYVGVRAIWRNAAPGRFEVFVAEVQRWVEVPEGRMQRMVLDDPSPWGGEAIVFYSVYADGVRIWCFNYDRTLY